jgi:hypothetical protein
MHGRVIIGSCFLISAAMLGGCASKPMNGAVIPMQGGGYQSVVKRVDKASAMWAFDQDAKVTCGKSSPIPALATPGKYSVVSQNASEKAGQAAKDIKTDNKALNAAIAIKFPQRDTPGSYELTTVFKCEPLN